MKFKISHWTPLLVLAKLANSFILTSSYTNICVINYFSRYVMNAMFILKILLSSGIILEHHAGNQYRFHSVLSHTDLPES